MFRSHQGTLAYDCPETRRAVLNSIVTNKLTLKKLDGSKLSLWCPRRVTSTVAVSSATIAGQASRPAGAVFDKIRTVHQPKDRKSPRPRCARSTTSTCQRA